MRSRTLSVGLCALLVTVAAATAAQAATAGAESVDAKWKQAMLAGDVNAAVDCYGKGAVLWLPGAPAAHGADEIRAAYTGFFAANTVKDVTMSETHYKTSGSLSTGWGRYSMTIAPKGGGADVTMTGRYTEVAERYKARWVYVADHASADPAPAPAAAPAKKK